MKIMINNHKEGRKAGKQDPHLVILHFEEQKWGKRIFSFMETVGVLD